MSVRPVRSQSSCGFPVLFSKYSTATDGLLPPAGAGAGCRVRHALYPINPSTNRPAAANTHVRARMNPSVVVVARAAVAIGFTPVVDSSRRRAARRSTTMSRMP